jgi:hypothetical protein
MEKQMDKKFFKQLHDSTEQATKKYVQTRNQKAREARKLKDAVYQSVGMTKAYSDSGRTYWE